LPYNVIAPILSSLQNGKLYMTDGSFILPCVGLESNTTLNFSFGGVEFPLRPQDLVYALPLMLDELM